MSFLGRSQCRIWLAATREVASADWGFVVSAERCRSDQATEIRSEGLFASIRSSKPRFCV